MIYELDGHRPEFPGEGQYWIAPNATLIGKVRLKPESSVWFGAVLRGDNEWIELGERSQIQDNATLHTDPGFALTIGPNCVIGHNVILHGCSIGANTLIGMGAIVLNGARIPENCLVGAGALITEGKTYPPGSLIVGAPARVLRPLEAEDIKNIAGGADIYVRRFKQYAKALKPVGQTARFHFGDLLAIETKADANRPRGRILALGGQACGCVRLARPGDGK